MSPDPITLPISASSKVLQVEKSFSTASGITLGDVLEATVLKNLGEGKLLIRLGGADTVTAESSVALRAGDTVSLQVEQLRPSLVLSVVGQSLAETEKVAEALRLQRANPGALLNMIVELLGKLSAKALTPYLSLLNPSHLKTMKELLETLSLSSRTAQGDQFVKNYITNLGLTWENALRKALTDTTIDPSRGGLKAALLALSAELKNISGQEQNLPGEVLKGLKSLEQLAAASVRTIESEQVVNVVSQENDSRYLLQIPLQFPSGTRTADLSIEFEGKDNEGRAGSGFRVLMLLDMDALGDLAVEASIREHRLGCRIQCTRTEVYTFIAQSLSSLRERLGGLGYRIESIDCWLEKDLTPVRETFNQYRSLGGRESVNIFI